MLINGGVDDVWHNLNTGQVIIVDYKSQASIYEVATAAYLANAHHQIHKVQMDVYAYLLSNMAFDVSEVSYFYVCNAVRSADTFDGAMVFTETLVPYAWDTSWMESSLNQMIEVLDSTELPGKNPACENCAYSFSRAEFEK